jgi:DNA replication and repair protein RecF
VLFGPHVNIIYGANASGKTTILEAVYMLSMAKSVRASSDNDLINFSEDSFLIKGTVTSNNIKSQLTLSFDKSGKRVKKNDTLFHNLSEFIGNINVVLFTPSDFMLFKKGPNERRSFIDLLICQLSKEYLKILSNYRKTLKERNALLKELHFHKSDNNMVLLETLTHQISDFGEQIIRYRMKVIDKILGLARIKYKMLSGTEDDFKINYLSSNDKTPLLQILLKGISDDIERGSTRVGPHTDDLVFYLNDKNIMDFGSQGEQKSIILSIKIAFLELIKEIKGEYPVLLLDDVFSELDISRQNALIKNMKDDIQTIITTTSLSDLDGVLISKASLFNMDKIEEMRE